MIGIANLIRMLSAVKNRKPENSGNLNGGKTEEPAIYVIIAKPSLPHENLLWITSYRLLVADVA
jgi:hypothetical protein